MEEFELRQRLRRTAIDAARGLPESQRDFDLRYKARKKAIDAVTGKSPSVLTDDDEIVEVKKEVFKYAESPEDKELRERLERGKKLHDLDPQWLYIFEKWQRHSIRCVNGHDYYEIDNVGSWHCRQHALPYDEKLKEWPCCKTPIYDHGCVKADHRPDLSPYELVHTIKGVPELVKESMKKARPGLNTEKNEYVRFDRSQHDRIIAESEDWRNERNKFEPEKKTVTVLFPELRNFRKYDQGIEHDGEEVIFWDGKEMITKTTNINLDQLSLFIFRQTPQEVVFKTGKVKTCSIVKQFGRKGILYRHNFTSKSEFTPLERVKQWEPL